MTRNKPKPDAAAMPSADADLFTLITRRRRFARRHRVADEEAFAADIRCEYPPAPAALGLSGATLARAPGPQIAPTQRSRTEASNV